MAAKKRALRLEMLMKMIGEYHAKHGRHTEITTTATGDAGATLLKNEGTAPDCERTGAGLRGTGVEQGEGQEDGTRQSSRHQAIKLTGSYNPKTQLDNTVGSDTDQNAWSADKTTGATLPAIGNPEPTSSFVSNKPVVDTAATATAQKSLAKQDRHSHPTMPTIVGTLHNPSASNEDKALHGGKCIAAVTPVTVVCICCGREGGKGHGRLCEHTFRRCGLCRVQEVERALYGAGGRRRRRRDGEVVRHETKPVRICAAFCWVMV